MEKIVIIGSPGAGKSTLGRKLEEILGIKVFHLDLYFWQPEWREKPKEIKRHILHRLIQNERWIIEGTYLDLDDPDIRLEAADTIIFLDMPVWLCLCRVLIRNFEYRRKQRPDLPTGCSEKLRMHFILKVLDFPSITRHRLYAKLYEFGNEKKVYTFHSRRQVDRFLWNLSQEQAVYESENPHILHSVILSIWVWARLLIRQMYQLRTVTLI